ncbi:ESPR-type extended signal peptide-containing protein [Megasphaera stantonii]|uniref:ESPR-type extended signal peptide-containing protein n=1 Tax=Megasphaera stantonii TaxID=2144175 RepID=UPI0023EF7B99|nr:ESPR-type extended signal peptide-containing protein [Megasphaera stantonii]
MNRIYKVIWSKVKHQYVVVSELAHRDGKKSKGIGRSAAALLTVLALTAGIGFMPVQAEEITIIEKTEGDNTADIKVNDELTDVVVTGKGNSFRGNTPQGEDFLVSGIGNVVGDNNFNLTLQQSMISGINNYIMGPYKMVDVTITGVNNRAEYLNSDGLENVIVYGNGNVLSSMNNPGGALKDVVFLGSNITSTASSGQKLENLTAIGQNLTVGASSGKSVFLGNNLNTNATSSVIIGINTTDDSYIADGANLTVVGVDNKVYGNNITNEPNTVVGYNNILGTTAGDNTTDATQGNTVMGTSNFVDGDGHRNVIYGFENKVYGLVEGSDSGSGYNTIIGQNNTIGVENSVPLNNVAIIGSQSSVTTDSSIVIGYNSHIDGKRGIAIGDNTYVESGADISAALGAGSRVNIKDITTGKAYKAKDNGAGWDFNPEEITNDYGYSVVSVGSTGGGNGGKFTRRIIDVAKGRVFEGSTDAVNGSQLRNYAVHEGSMKFENGTLTMNWTDDYGIGDGWTDSVAGIASTSYVDEKVKNAGGEWTLTTNGGTTNDEKTTIGKDSVVDFSGAKDASNNNHQNINVTQEQTDNGTNVTFDLNDKVILGTGDSQITIDATDNNGIFAIGESSALGGTTGVFMNAAGQANFGAIKFNQDTEYTPAGQEEQHSSTVTGLSNTYWDANDENIANAGRAATEEQLKAAISQVEAGAYSGWNVSGGDSTFASVDKEHNKVHFDGAVRNEGQENEHQNITVSQSTNDEGYDLTFDLNDKVVLGTGDSQITIDAINGTFAIGSTSTLDSTTGVFMNSIGQAHLGAIHFNQDTTPDPEGHEGQHSSTITGLSNTYWDANDDNIANAGRAATEEQLKAAISQVEAGAYSGWNVSGGDSTFASVDKEHNKVHFDGTVRNEGQEDEHQNINVSQAENADQNGYDLTFDLNDKVVLGTGNDQIIIDATAGNGSLLIGGTSGVSISRSGENNGYILDGLSNITWDYAKYEAGDYKTSHKAATEAQLHGAFDYLNTKIDNLEVGGSVDTDDGNITVRPGDDQTQTGKGDGDYNLGLNDDVVLGGFNEAGEVDNTVEGSLTIVTGIDDDGNPTKVTINADKDGVATIDGLGNKTWDWNKYEQGDYKDSGTGATEAQLHGAMEGTVQYDRVTDEDGNVTIDKTNITLNPDGDSVTIHNVARGEKDTDAVNVSQLNEAWDQINNNTTAITNIGNKVGELDSRIDEVGAGAAALAALHPLDFDPDDKWDFSAGYGNYRGESAVAIGAFYRPNEDTMFSVGGTVGNGDNMVNAGVSFKIGQGNGVSTSRVAMAKEIKSMRDIVAKQDAQIQKLTAMVNALVGVQTEPDTTTMFPDVPENHWAYEAVEAMAKSGLVKGYPDGEFKGDRTMTRYEFAQIVYNAIQAGAEVDARLVEEFKPELQFFHIATVAKDKDGNPTIERVRAN